MNLDQSPDGPGKWFSSESAFHQLYSPSLQNLARNHWTPLLVAAKAAAFLAAEKGKRILDIGSGIGKFCLAAGYYQPGCCFIGVEQRKDLVDHARHALEVIGLSNVSFIHGNVTGIDFREYDHFYFYNAFYENLVIAEKIDHEVEYSIERYNEYSRALYRKLEKMPAGTRIVTYHGMNDVLPPDYLEGGSDVNGLLKYWVKA